MRRVISGLKKSRLSKYVLYRHAGYVKDIGFTGNFKPMIIKLRRSRELPLIKEGWYLVKKAATNPTIMVTIEDLEPLSTLDLLDLGRRMRMRLFKLFREMGEKGGRIDKRMRIVPITKLSHRLLEYELALLLLKPGGVVEFEKLPFTTIIARLGKTPGTYYYQK